MTRISALLRIAINMRAAQIKAENEPSEQNNQARTEAENKFDVTLYNQLNEPTEEKTPDPRAAIIPY